MIDRTSTGKYSLFRFLCSAGVLTELSGDDFDRNVALEAIGQNLMLAS